MMTSTPPIFSHVPHLYVLYMINTQEALSMILLMELHEQIQREGLSVVEN